MKVMRDSWQDRRQLQRNFGESCRSFKKRSAPKAAFLTWRRRWYPELPLIRQDILVEGKKELEKVVGLQTDKPLKRAFMPYRRYQDGGAGLHNLWI